MQRVWKFVPQARRISDDKYTSCICLLYLRVVQTIFFMIEVRKFIFRQCIQYPQVTNLNAAFSKFTFMSRGATISKNVLMELS